MIQLVFNCQLLNYPSLFRSSSAKNTPSKASPNTGLLWLKEPGYQQEKFNHIDHLVRSKSTVLSSEYQRVSVVGKPNYEALDRSGAPLDEIDGTQPQLRRSVVTIRNNNTKSKQFKNTGAVCQSEPRGWANDRHKSLFIKGPDYVTECEPAPVRSAGSDYLLNSETLYRDEIRKSIK